MQQLDRAALSLLMLSPAIAPRLSIQIGHFDHMVLYCSETTRTVGTRLLKLATDGAHWYNRNDQSWRTTIRPAGLGSESVRIKLLPSRPRNCQAQPCISIFIAKCHNTTILALLV